MTPIEVYSDTISDDGYCLAPIPDWVRSTALKTPDDISVRVGVDTLRATVLGFGLRVMELRLHPPTHN